MISMISELWSQSHFTPIQKHVYGHQNENDGPLTRMGKLNNKMDIMAKSIALEYMASGTTLQLKSSSLGIGTITCGGELVTSRVQHSLYTNILHNNIVSWYSRKHHIQIDLFETKSIMDII